MKNQWYEQVPKLVETNHGSKAAILWNQLTDSTIIINKNRIS
jgi:hypothetical protein